MYVLQGATATASPAASPAAAVDEDAQLGSGPATAEAEGPQLDPTSASKAPGLEGCSGLVESSEGLQEMAEGDSERVDAQVISSFLNGEAWPCSALFMLWPYLSDGEVSSFVSCACSSRPSKLVGSRGQCKCEIRAVFLT